MRLVKNKLGFSSGEVRTYVNMLHQAPVLDQGRLAYWARSKFVIPSIATPTPGRATRRCYSFHDLLEIAVAVQLRAAGFSLQSLRDVQTQLREDFDERFGQAWLISNGVDIFRVFYNEEQLTSEIVSLLRQPRQRCLPLIILDLWHTRDQLIESIALNSQETKKEIIELLAHGVDVNHVSTLTPA